MRRKLIKQDAFEQMTSSSVTAAERELAEVENVLARALGKDRLALHSFTNSTVLYETLEDTYIHAGYQLKERDLTFNNIEELVIDEDSRKQKVRGVLSEMLDAIMTGKRPQASRLLKNYMQLVTWNDVTKPLEEAKKGKKLRLG